MRYAIVGLGSRAQMYLDACVGAHRDVAELVAVADVNRGRIGHHLRRIGADLPAYASVEELLAAQTVDRVIVTTPDYTHASIVIAALEAGADVIVEKPLTIDADSCRDIAATIEKTGKSVTVTFNYRYSPRNSALREVIAAGQIGKVTSVHFEWVLDTAHGADYYRRWHREKAKSGGLLVHKASHHFDLVNWWIHDIPTRVYASGGLRFYGSENASARGLVDRPPRGSIDVASRDPFMLDMRENPTLKALYLDNESYDGYLRDQDVFAPGITIEDNMSVIVDYASGATMSYSLNSHSPWEGYVVSVNGTEGRAELTVVERGAVLADSGRPVVDPSASPEMVAATESRPQSEKLVVQRHWQAAQEVPITGGDGAHGGGDAKLLRDVFVGASGDPLSRASDYRDGVRSIAVGIAANTSIATGHPITIADLDLRTDLSWPT
ncbi:Gfo/Idh/MocA family protein [Fodinicola acaciae]|uniref:Gfo/Idh/MocA family protein n=1 Tax=Fodinicola acaciae TaxID=2681555 RepID=UPI001C9E41BB|nr:Gfo/Idh/MocA family oxidoreductase [Fodinicola acaciae]